jgi:zinc protease
MARRVTACPSPSWAADLPVFEQTFDNGLKALVLPRADSPVVICDLFYPVGSVDEPQGKTGIAHFVEHMLFKGTERFPKGQIDRLAFLAAGQTNAETTEDDTHYWFAFPSQRWELALEIEADRMRHAVFDPREVDAERQVIAEERARDLDSPQGRLEQDFLALSYLTHPYRNPVLGWPEDVRKITAADLRAFYQAHYRPDGAVLVLAGALEPNRVFDGIAAHYGDIPRGPSAPRRPVEFEPPQNGRRAFRLNEPDAVPRGLLGWHTVPQGHPDQPALDVLADLLTYGRRARLWDRLVERDRLATWVDVTHEPSRLAGQLYVQLEGDAHCHPERLEAVIIDTINEFAQDGPTTEELERSRRRLEAAWRWEQGDLSSLATGLGHRALWGDWRSLQVEHRAAMAVSADDIRRVASTYIADHGLVVGWSLPNASRVITPTPTGIVQPARDPAPAARLNPIPTLELPVPPLWSNPPSPSLDYRPKRFVMDNGLRVLSERIPGTGTVAIELYVDAGQLRETKPGLAYLTGRWREEGTRKRSSEELAATIEDVGGTLDVGATGASMRVRAEDLPLAFDLLGDVIRHPAFPADALAWLRKRTLTELRADRDDPIFQADEAFRALIHGTHPYGRDPRGNARTVAQLTRDDVLKHHRGFFTPDNAFLVAVGDFDPRALRKLIRETFGDWKPSRRRTASLPDHPAPWRKRSRRIVHDGEQVHVLIGHLGVPRTHPDYDALLILDHILGSGPGFSDRLSRHLRDEMGLAYVVGGGMTDSSDVMAGQLRIYVGTSPADAGQAIAAVREEISAVHRGAFSDDEAERARGYLAGSWVFDYQTVGQRAERLFELERWGLPLDEPQKFPRRIQSVTPDAVRAAAARNLRPQSLVQIVLGPAVARRGR